MAYLRCGMAIGPIPRGWGRWVGLAGASTYSFWWCAAHGCWSWLDFDGREGVCRAFAVFKRRRARLSARRLDGDPVDLAAGRPKPRKILYQC